LSEQVLGTTSILASLTFPLEGEDLTKRIVEHLKLQCGQIKEGQSVLAGIHAEGPIIRTLGGLPQSKTDYSLEEFNKYIDFLCSAGLKVMTISPSLESKVGYCRLKALFDRGVVPALGHDREATEEDILGALKIAKEKQKRCHMTHIFNVSNIHHRDMGLVNFGLVSSYPKLDSYRDIEEPTIELIGDFEHVHPLALTLALASKDHKKIAFITDAIMDGSC